MTISEKLSELLFTNEHYVAVTEEDKKVLNKTIISSHAREYQPELLTLLQSDEEIKNHFFTGIASNNPTSPLMVVFKLDNFLTFINNRSYFPDSFTAFRKQIGLATDKDNYLADNRNVVLNWVYKDCILEGGQTKDDQKRQEVFFNEILAPDQINRLLDDKVFVNWKRYTLETEQVETPEKLIADEKQVVKETVCSELKKNDNLIIKGNNLVVLQSLKKRFAGKVKLIYIDPPYNTGNDSFGYNDKFNHSTWLTFMKNRLEVAKDLLREDGFVAIQCDDKEQAYLKVLMDEIFRSDNFLISFYIRVRYPDKTLTQDMSFHKEIETIHIFRKSILSKPKRIEIEKDIDKYEYYFNEIGIGKEIFLGEKKVIVFNKDEIEIRKKEASNEGRKEIWASGTILDGNSSGRFFRDFLNGRFIEDGYGAVYKVFGVGDEINGFRYFTGPQRRGATKGKYYQGIPETQLTLQNNISTIPINNFYDLAGNFGNCRSEGGVELRSGKKPEELLKIVLTHFSNERDLILDYHLGSGTTCAVAHKMGRQFIGVEQLDYGENDSVIRLQNVLNGEQRGISKFANWHGGGEFVYCELANDAENFRNEIKNAEVSELPALLEKAKQSSFLSYRVDREKFNGYEKLTEEEQRILLLQLVDANTLYVNYSDIESKDYSISEADKKMNKQFYGK